MPVLAAGMQSCLSSEIDVDGSDSSCRHRKLPRVRVLASISFSQDLSCFWKQLGESRKQICLRDYAEDRFL
jgi:hypothetical protein